MASHPASRPCASHRSGCRRSNYNLRVSLGPDDLMMMPFDPELYVSCAIEQQYCGNCGEHVAPHPIANFWTVILIEEPNEPHMICDRCAEMIASAASFALMRRTRDVLSRSDFGIDTVAAVRWDDAKKENYFVDNRCSHCELSFVAGTPGTTHWIEWFLCDKGTREPICDTCAELLASRELLDLLRDLRNESRSGR